MKGTEKQVKWAEDIKERAIFLIELELKNARKMDSLINTNTAEMWEMAVETIHKLMNMPMFDDAAVVIEKRKNIERVTNNMLDQKDIAVINYEKALENMKKICGK